MVFTVFSGYNLGNKVITNSYDFNLFSLICQIFELKNRQKDYDSKKHWFCGVQISKEQKCWNIQIEEKQNSNLVSLQSKRRM